MGSFLISCCVTNQTITDGEEVYIIPIHENGEYTEGQGDQLLKGLGRLTYNTDLYGLTGHIFEGTYADYGRYDIDWEKTSNKFMLQRYLTFLSKSAYSMEQGANEYHDVEFKPENLELTPDNHQAVWEYLHEGVWESRAFMVKQTYTSTAPKVIANKLEYFIVKKKYADIFINMYRESRLNAYYYSEEAKEFYTLSLEEKAKRLFDEASTYLAMPNEDENKLTTYLKITQDKRYIHFLGENLSDASVADRLYKSNQINLVESFNGDFDSFLEVYKAYANIKDLIVAMMYANLYVRPVYYASQDYGNSFGSCFSYLMDIVHQDNIDKYEEYVEDEDIEEAGNYLLAFEKHAKSFSY